MIAAAEKRKTVDVSDPWLFISSHFSRLQKD